MKYFIKTFGCQMNTSDSERIAAFLEKQGFSLAEKITTADLAIFNTCGIKQTAENRAYSIINNLRKDKKDAVKIIMTGCLANRADVQKRMKKSVNLFTEIKNFPRDFEIMNQESRITENLNLSHDSSLISQENIGYLSIKPKYNNKFQAFVPIMTGCNNFCTYCVVPYARGREVSRPAEEIITEVEKLVKGGYKGIMLLGQNVNSYASQVHKAHKENTETIDFTKLLKKLMQFRGNSGLVLSLRIPKI